MYSNLGNVHDSGNIHLESVLIIYGFSCETSLALFERTKILTIIRFHISCLWLMYLDTRDVGKRQSGFKIRRCRKQKPSTYRSCEDFI